MMKFVSSGFLVVGMPKYINNTLYCGVDTQVFPVGDICSNITSSNEYELSQQDLCYAFFLNYANALEYYMRCKDMNISVRMIYCESTAKGCKFPLVNKNANKTLFLGYDYAYPSGDYYSTVANEILYSHIPDSTKWRSSLNLFGLFDSAEIVSSYIEDRNYQKGKFNVDNCFETGNFYVFRIYEIEDMINNTD